jgi:hypothetical protein
MAYGEDGCGVELVQRQKLPQLESRPIPASGVA